MVALDAMPTAEVRYFNPFVMRSPRVLNYVFGFFRLNRRMPLRILVRVIGWLPVEWLL
jgi:hypothetical protein